jgi:CRISPR-associated exonuclease Cas4
MLGDRNIRGMIEKALDRLHDDLNIKIDKKNPDRIHALEATLCTRLSYYERKDPIPEDNASKISILLGHGIRNALSNINAEYKIDSLTLDTNADMLMGEEFVVRFEIVPELPLVPHPRHLLYLNACLFALHKDEGILIYLTADGRSVEYSVTRNNRMFEEIVRRARVLSTLLKDNKVPIIEPSDLCMKCKYYSRCYSREKTKETTDLLQDIFGKLSPK